MALCPTCFVQQFCRRWLIVTPDEMRNPYFIIDARNFIYERKIEHTLDLAELLDELLYAVDLMEGDFRNGAWIKFDLRTDVFEVPDTAIDEDRGAVVRESILDWIEYNFGQSWTDEVNAQLHGIGKERFIVMASLARAIWWPQTRFWGERAANDNTRNGKPF